MGGFEGGEFEVGRIRGLRRFEGGRIRGLGGTRVFKGSRV